ncbi:hypothetical protein ALC60_08735 [Trachymyrmex zeteki]|uniref:Uncharacterized protein n=1 Tax=Mycetomoellerius zeteki TaxID=64791 RepID=A0A151WWS5_9HYME|nr:hypothetical protein ALC60_08735 [Trachymyrmex zeteki]
MRLDYFLYIFILVYGKSREIKDNYGYCAAHRLTFQRIVFFDSSERVEGEGRGGSLPTSTFVGIEREVHRLIESFFYHQTNLSEFLEEHRDRLPSYTTKVINIECFALSSCDGRASGRFDE